MLQKRDHTQFIQGDACNLPTVATLGGQFGCILAANLICRLHSPYSFLDRLAGLVAPGGVLVITSPYTWLEQFTQKVSNLLSYHLKCSVYCNFVVVGKTLVIYYVAHHNSIEFTWTIYK